MIEALAEAIGEGPYTCDQMATRVEQFATSHGPRMAALSARLRGLTEEQETALDATHGKRLEELQERMIPGLKACAGDERLVRAMKALSEAAPAYHPMEAKALETFCAGWKAAVVPHQEACDELGKAVAQYFVGKDLQSFLATNLEREGAIAKPCRDAWTATLACYDTPSVKAALKALENPRDSSASK